MDRKNSLNNVQRARNILTLEERVRAIEAYDINPVYTKVSKLFNCSWEQIKNIIANRETIMKFYEATKRTECNIDANKCEIRQNKITFLGECMYEYIQRAQFHTKVDVTEELIRIKAFEFLEIIQIENFIPNRTWMNHFKATYGFCLSNRQIKITRKPPTSLDVKDIMTYCTKNNVKNETLTTQPTNPGRNLYRTATKIAVSSANDATLQELEQRQAQKKNLLERAFLEFMDRLKHHHKMFLPVSEYLKAAGELKQILQVDKFEPSKKWFKEFMMRAKIVKNRTNVRSSTTLDLSDIISHCVQQENYNSPSDINQSTKSNTEELPTCSKTRVTPKRTPSGPIGTPVKKIRILSPEALKNTALDQIHLEKCRPIIKEEIIDSEDESEDVKPNVEELHQKQKILNEEINNNFHEPLIKIQKSESNESESENSTPDCDNRITEDSELFPKNVNNCEDALKLLKPLQEYALMQENYRAIGLLSQLEDSLKYPRQNHK